MRLQLSHGGRTHLRIPCTSASWLGWAGQARRVTLPSFCLLVLDASTQPPTQPPSLHRAPLPTLHAQTPILSAWSSWLPSDHSSRAARKSRLSSPAPPFRGSDGQTQTAFQLAMRRLSLLRLMWGAAGVRSSLLHRHRLCKPTRARRRNGNQEQVHQ